MSRDVGTSRRLTLVEIWLPYGSSEIPVRVAEERLVGILNGQASRTSYDLLGELSRSIGTNDAFLGPANRAERVCIAMGYSSDPNASTSITKALIAAITGGASRPAVTILRTPDAPVIELDLFGDVKIVNHGSGSAVVPLPNLRGSSAPSIDQTFAEADVAVVVGELKPHCLLERSGLTDIILPGLASSDSIQSHLSREDGSLAGLYKERIEVAGAIKNLFAAGFVLDVDRAVVGFSFGDLHAVLRELDVSLRSTCTVAPRKTADIVVMSAGGKPTDESLLRTIEAFPQGLAALKREGALIVASECAFGHGGTEFYDWCAERKEPRYLEARLRHRFNYNGFKAALLMRAVEGHRVYLVSTIPDHYVEGVFGMKAAVTVNSALQTAQRALGSDSEVSVIPDATRVVVKQPDRTQ